MAMCASRQLRFCPSSKARMPQKEGDGSIFRQSGARFAIRKCSIFKDARILIAKPVPTFAEFARLRAMHIRGAASALLDWQRPVGMVRSRTDTVERRLARFKRELGENSNADDRRRRLPAQRIRRRPRRRSHADAVEFAGL